MCSGDAAVTLGRIQRGRHIGYKMEVLNSRKGFPDVFCDLSMEFVMRCRKG